MGDPAQENQVQRTDTTAGDEESTDQATGAREMRKAGPPGKTPSHTTQRDTVDASQTITEALRDAENFSTLNKVVDAAGLREVLDQPGPFTVFAPTDEAFDKIPEATLDEWMKPENKEQLSRVLLGHVVAGELLAEELTAGTITTSGETSLTVSTDGEHMMINDATITQPDLNVSNGVIHAVDTVIVPEMEEEE